MAHPFKGSKANILSTSMSRVPCTRSEGLVTTLLSVTELDYIYSSRLARGRPISTFLISRGQSVTFVSYSSPFAHVQLDAAHSQGTSGFGTKTKSYAAVLRCSAQWRLD